MVGALAVLGQLEAPAVVEPAAAAELVLEAAGAELVALDEELDELLPQAETASPAPAIKSSATKRLRMMEKRGGIGARG